MIRNKVLGIIFANSHDAMLGELTEHRSMGSVPFGGRYRLIDFVLSNLSNAGIGKVGVITKANYFSLMTHLGTGKPWDLDRKNGGLSILPPYMSPDAQVYKGKLEAIYGILEYLVEAKEETVVLCDSDIVASIDVKALLKAHVESGADITAVYANGKKYKGQGDSIDFTIDTDGRITAVCFDENKDICDYSLDTIVLGRELLINIVVKAINEERVSLSHEIFEINFNRYKICGFKHEGFSAVLDSPEAYFEANMALLNCDVRRSLFSPENPVHTKTNDDMPAKYGINSNTANSLIADGCVIEGSVKNSILFRGVKVAKDAVVENCILMEGTEVGTGSVVKNVVADRFVKITDNKELDGKGKYIAKKSFI